MPPGYGPCGEAARTVDCCAPGAWSSPTPRSDQGEPRDVGVQVRPGRGVDCRLAHSHSGAGPPEVRPSREDETLAAGLHDGGETSAVTMPHLGGLPTGPIREVRMQNYRVGPPPWGGGGGATCRARLWSAGTRQTSRLQVAAWVGLGPSLPTKRRSRVVAGIQWVRLSDTMHTPITGVAKRASSPNTVITLNT